MRLLLFCWAALLSGLCFGQATSPAQISGRIIDQSGTALPSAQLILRNGEQIIGFGMSDGEGRFEVEVPAKADTTTTLEARFFGYAPRRLPLGEAMASAPLEIQLSEEGVDLKEVVVAADALPQLVKDDTISFRTEAYRDGSEDKIEDVIAKLPGVEVSEAGDITVDGKPLDRILLEGEDIFDRSYQTLSRNVPADYVTQIDVLSNYQPDQLTGDLQGQGETVMNLKLDPARKSLFFGNVDGSVGTEQYRDLESALFLLRRRIKLVNFARYTTTGRDPSPGSDLQHRMSGPGQPLGTAIAPVLGSPALRQSRQLKPVDYRRNQGYGVAQSLLLRPTESIKNRLIVNFGRDSSRLAETRIREFPTEGTAFSLAGNYQLDLRDLWLKNDLSVMVGKRSRLDLETILINQRTTADALSTTSALQSSGEEFNNTSLRSEPSSLNNRLRLVTRIDERTAINLEGRLVRERYDQFQTYTGRIYEELLGSDGPSFGQLLNREFRGSSFGADVLRRYQRHTVQFAVGHRRERTVTAGLLAPVNRSGDLPDRVDFHFRESFSQVVWTFKESNWKLNGRAKLSLFSLPFNLEEQANTQEMVNPQFSVGGERRISRRGKLALGFGSSVRPVSPDESIPFTYLREQTSLNAGLDSAFLLRSHTANASYTYRNVYREYGYGIYATYTAHPNALFQRFDPDGLLFRNRLAPGGSSTMASLTVSGNTRLTRSGIMLRSSASLFRMTDRLAVNEFASRSVGHNLTLTTDLTIPISQRVKHSMKGRWQYFDNRFGSVNTTQQQLHLEHHLVYRPIKALQTITTYRTFLPNLGNNGAAVHLLDQAIRFRPKDTPYNLRLGVLNLLNQGQLTQRSVDPYLVVERSYRLRPRTVYLDLGINF